MSLNLDIYSSENEPRAREYARLYRVEPPKPLDREFYAIVGVYASDDNAWLDRWKWFDVSSKRGGYRLSDPEDLKRWNAMREVWEWLMEWELVELQPISHEESEYFATKKLLAMPTVDRIVG